MSKNKYANQPPKSPNKKSRSQPEPEEQAKQQAFSASSDPMLRLPDLAYIVDLKESRHDGFELENVPMEYRAQIPGRCQWQFISDDTKGNDSKSIDVVTWAHEWSIASSDHPPVGAIWPEAPSPVHFVEVDIQQRLVSNSGLDADLIRPVIGGNGWPIIPGSSIKGLFRRQCRLLNEPRLTRWCGNACGIEPCQQGKLRFHGAYPCTRGWKDKNGVFLVDIAHPQQKWQVGFKDKKHPAYAIISLRKPSLNIAVSSSDPSIGEDEWQDIKEILSHAFVCQGIGGRTCAGYGVSGSLEPNDMLFECAIAGRGSAPMLLGGQPEFRTTMFRAAIRDMALRVFGGLTSEERALEEVANLFGGIEGDKPTRSLLSCRYVDMVEPIISKSRTRYVFDVFTAAGKLQWTLNERRKSFAQSEINDCRSFLEALHGLALVLGGFGKGWRRIDHEFFGASLSEGKYEKAPIGCHWQWGEPARVPNLLRVDGPRDVATLLHAARDLASKRLGANLGEASTSSWQEVIDPRRMLIWTRPADDVESSVAMKWFHAKQKVRDLPDCLCLNRTALAGRLQNKKFNDGPTCVSRIWHRMYPLQSGPETRRGEDLRVRPVSNAAAFQRASRGTPHRQQGRQADLQFWNGPFMEIIVLFPFDQERPGSFYVPGAQAFIEELDNVKPGGFERLNW